MRAAASGRELGGFVGWVMQVSVAAQTGSPWAASGNRRAADQGQTRAYGLPPTLQSAISPKDPMNAQAIDDDDTLGSQDAIDLLQADHDEVKQLFEDYESLIDDDAPDADREALAREICDALTVHTTMEEELLYPAAREALDSSRLVDAAAIEHASAKSLIAEIESMSASDALFDARVTVLGEYVKHHIDEEEEELLPQLADAGVDLEALGAQLAQRRQELLADLDEFAEVDSSGA